jgi:hypothetical protein
LDLVPHVPIPHVQIPPRKPFEPPQTSGIPPTTQIYQTIRVCSTIARFAANFPVGYVFNFSPKQEMGRADFSSANQIHYVSPPQKISEKIHSYISIYDENMTLLLTNLLQTVLI